MKTVLLMILLSTTALAGVKEVGNGGDALALEFSTDLSLAWKLLQNSKDPIFAELRGIELDTALPQLKIVTVDDPLETDLGDIKQESTAINIPANQLILVNRARWMSINNSHLKEALALHEVLSLIGKESSGVYKYSAAYLTSFGLDAGQLAQAFVFVENTLEYKVGGDTYSITGKERYYPSVSTWNTVRIDYEVKKNGKILRSSSDMGGSMLSCSYGDPSSPDFLRRQFISLASSPTKTFGFLIKGLGICGNTTSFREQLIVPQPNIYEYEVKEFKPKTEPVIRENAAGKPELWYIDQVWGHCGTAGSFFVPNLILPLGNEYGGIQIGKMPTNFQDIPSFDSDYPLDAFRSLYVAGLRTHDWQAMELSKRYFQTTPDFLKWNEWCGLPTAVDDLDGKVQAMKILGDQLDIFQ